MAVVQVQSRLLDEQGFRDTVALLQAGQAQLRNHVRARAADLLHCSMQRCLALWRSRTRRRARLDRLKRTLNHSRGFAGADPRTLLEDAFAAPARGPGSDPPGDEEGRRADGKGSTGGPFTAPAGQESASDHEAAGPPVEAEAAVVADSDSVGARRPPPA